MNFKQNCYWSLFIAFSIHTALSENLNSEMSLIVGIPPMFHWIYASISWLYSQEILYQYGAIVQFPALVAQGMLRWKKNQGSDFMLFYTSSTIFLGFYVRTNDVQPHVQTVTVKFIFTAIHSFKPCILHLLGVYFPESIV